MVVGRAKLTIYFTAEKRSTSGTSCVTLMRSDAHELRQIGVRDEAARLGGVGRCGKEYCCSTWLKELSPVNLGLAKDQHLSLNPSQISGGCGRLLCCLKYEHEFYVASRKRFPKEGKSCGPLPLEKVVAVEIFRERSTYAPMPRREDPPLEISWRGDAQSSSGTGIPGPGAAPPHCPSRVPTPAPDAPAPERCEPPRPKPKLRRKAQRRRSPPASPPTRRRAVSPEATPRGRAPRRNAVAEGPVLLTTAIDY